MGVWGVTRESEMDHRSLLKAAMAAGVLASAAAVGGAAAQEAPRTELGARLVEHHGDEAFLRLEDVKLRESVAYPEGAALGALKTPAGRLPGLSLHARHGRRGGWCQDPAREQRLERRQQKTPRRSLDPLRLGHRRGEALSELACVGGSRGQRVAGGCVHPSRGGSSEGSRRGGRAPGNQGDAGSRARTTPTTR